eukprot:6623933-Alexandrium_andersonii.AAC.1
MPSSRPSWTRPDGSTSRHCSALDRTTHPLNARRTHRRTRTHSLAHPAIKPVRQTADRDRREKVGAQPHGQAGAGTARASA